MILIFLLLQMPPLDALHSKDVDTRRAAAVRIMDGDAATRKQALPALIEGLLKEKDGQVRLAAFEAITRLGPDAATAVPALIHCLKTDYGGQQKEELHQDFRAALALGAIGKPSVGELRKLLDARKESVRAEVIMGLGKVGPDAAPAVPELIPRLDDSSARLRREAATALGRIGSPAIDALIHAASSDKVNMRAGAVEAMGQTASPTLELNAAVIKASADREATVRRAAFRSLARLTVDPDTLVAPLKSGLTDKDGGVRLAASDALLARRPLLIKSSPWLAEQLRAKDDGVAQIAAHLLGQAGPDAAPLLLAALPDPSTRIPPIAQALAHHGRPAVPSLLKSAKSDNARVRQAVALAIGSIRPLPTEALPTLAAALSDPDAGVRSTALSSLASLGARSKPAANAVAALLKDPSPDVRRRSVEVLAVALPRDPAMLGQITPLLDDSDPAVQRAVIATIRNTGPLGQKALPAIAAKLEKGPDDVRIAAAEFVGAQGAASAKAAPMLLKLLDETPLPLRLAAVNALGKIGPGAQAAAPRVASLLDSPTPEAREAAIVALGNLELDGPSMRPYLSKALRDKDAKVWGAGLRSLQRLGPQSVLFLPDIIRLTAQPGARQTAQRALRRFERQPPDPAIVSDLIPLLDHESDSVRLLAIKFLALTGHGATPAIPALERLRDHKNPEVREQAEAACKQIKK